MGNLTLFTYFRSSAAYRVRIALNLKRLDYHALSVNLIKDGGEHLQSNYAKINPQRLLPTLTDDDLILTQSLAIIEYLEETFPIPSLLPTATKDRAYVRALAQLIASDIHPLNNLRVLNYLTEPCRQTTESVQSWYKHWVEEGFMAIETLLQTKNAKMQFCFGHIPSLADICLIPQVYNAKRYDCPLQPFPRIRSIYSHCMELEPFRLASPENQPDYISSEEA